MRGQFETLVLKPSAWFPILSIVMHVEQTVVVITTTPGVGLRYASMSKFYIQ